MNENAPTVSVVLPTYNRASLLGTAIESVLGQSFCDLELVVVDDGSTDDTGDLVRRYRDVDVRVRYLRQENRGISAAINAGIRAAAGEWIARIDSDDQWLPELLEVELSVLKTRPEAGLVYSKALWRDPGLAPLPVPVTIGHAPHFPHDMTRSMLWGDATCNITVLVRRECFDRAGFFDESLTTSEDWDMWLRASLLYPFVFVDRVLAHVRRHANSTTNTQAPSFGDFLGSRHKVLDKFFSRVDLSPEIAAMKAAAYRNLYVFEGNVWAGCGEWRRAFSAFRKALQSGVDPVATAARIVWFAFGQRIFNLTSAGRAFLQWDSNRRLRARGSA